MSYARAVFPVPAVFNMSAKVIAPASNTSKSLSRSGEGKYSPNIETRTYGHHDTTRDGIHLPRANPHICYHSPTIHQPFTTTPKTLREVFLVLPFEVYRRQPLKSITAFLRFRVVNTHNLEPTESPESPLSLLSSISLLSRIHRCPLFSLIKLCT